MRDIVFEKKKGYGGTVNRTRDYAEKAVRKVPQRRYYEKFRKIQKKKICAGVSFLIKVDIADLKLH